MVEMNFSEKGGKSATGMKAVSIEKVNFNKITDGYFIKNYVGLSMREMMQKESDER